MATRSDNGSILPRSMAECGHRVTNSSMDTHFKRLLLCEFFSLPATPFWKSVAEKNESIFMHLTQSNKPWKRKKVLAWYLEGFMFAGWSISISDVWRLLAILRSMPMFIR